jgi:hypothetical protein
MPSDRRAVQNELGALAPNSHCSTESAPSPHCLSENEQGIAGTAMFGGVAGLKREIKSVSEADRRL